MLMNLYGYNNKYYATLNNDIMQDYWHKLILPQQEEKPSVTVKHYPSFNRIRKYFIYG